MRFEWEFFHPLLLIGETLRENSDKGEVSLGFAGSFLQDKFKDPLCHF